MGTATKHDHILVVDDEKSVRDVIKDALEYYGYQVTLAITEKRT